MRCKQRNAYFLMVTSRETDTIKFCLLPAYSLSCGNVDDAHSFSGVAGSSVSIIPVALWMTLIIAEPADIVACSPTPLAPYGPVG